MKTLILTLVWIGIFAGSSSAQAQDLSFLFIGNSYTYLPGQGSEDDPALPKLIQQIARSIDPTLNMTYAFNTQGGWNFQKHFNDPKAHQLMTEHYDQVILQGQSIESLELTPWFHANGNPGVEGFEVYLPKILDLVFKTNSHVTLYVNWGYNAKNALLQENQPGLYFPAGTPRAGQKWCGNDRFEYQRMIDESYALHSQGYPVSLSHVGDAWLLLQTQGIVTEDELYLEGDWSHPSLLGGFVNALVLVRDVLHLDITENSYIPAGVDPDKAAAIEDALSQDN